MIAPTFERPFADLTPAELHDELEIYARELAHANSPTHAELVRADMALVRAEIAYRAILAAGRVTR